MEVKRKSQTYSSSSFLLTLNQIERFDNLKNYLISLKTFQYGIAGKEKAPTTGHEHIHIFIQFSKSTRLSIKRMEGCHIDKCLGTPQQNKNYVSKEGNIIWESGEIKKKGFPSIAEVKLMSRIDREKLPLQYFNPVNKINIDEDTSMKVSKMYKHIKVYYVSGVSGIGKTQFAKYLIGEQPFNLVKYENSFWIGVRNTEKAALYDDWRDTHMKPSEFLNFIDYNRHVINIKGGYIINNYELIVITSIQSMEFIYRDIVDESRYQWERRIKEIKLGVMYNHDRRKKFNQLFDIIIKCIKLYIFKLLNNFIEIKDKINYI